MGLWVASVSYTHLEVAAILGKPLHMPAMDYNTVCDADEPVSYTHLADGAAAPRHGREHDGIAD